MDSGFDWNEIDWQEYSRVWLWIGMLAGAIVSVGIYLMGRRLLRSSPDRRANSRRWGKPVEVLVTGLRPMPHIGMVVNRSEGGLGLLLDKPMRPGLTFRVRPTEAPSAFPWIDVESRHCTATGRDWLVGCRFTDDVPWDVRVWFG
ncbi:MAG: hypothetical protein K2R98_26965 [Gemmataceae bacterium]|nr:hypothetical protein [Gemmataceae bacterium]